MRLKFGRQSFVFYKQPSSMDCGPTCLRMVSKYHGKHFSVEGIKKYSGFSREGVSLLGIREAAEQIGLKAKGVQMMYEELISEAMLPAILHWNQNHFIVLPKQTFAKNKIIIADPGQNGLLRIPVKTFMESWLQSKKKDKSTGIALLLEPTSKFYEQKEEKENTLNWRSIVQYLKETKWKVVNVSIALLVTSLFQFIFPVLTQNIVDKGIKGKDLSFLTLIILGQLMLIVTRTGIDFIKARLLFRISTHINLSVLSRFWVKLTHLPLSYFENHHTAETFQRIFDHRQIENFITSTAITTIFSIFNFIVFAIVLIFYNSYLFFVFIIGSVLYFIWITLFLRMRRKVNYGLFHLATKENNVALQLVQGMQELKLYHAENSKREEWQKLQSEFYKLNFKSLSLNQIQQAGAIVLNEGRNLLITFLAAKLVIEGQLTLGVMLAVQYIIGQLSSPVEQFVGFIQSAQDAKISMERLNEIHQLPDEESDEKKYIQLLPYNKTLRLQNVSFAYPGTGNEHVLKNINLEIPEGKVTAIVGVSGSGKTTLLKLLLRFFEQYQGKIKIGNEDFSNISPSLWRKHCGAVLQNGYIFNDSIAKNIAPSEETINYEKLIYVCTIANILSFIDSLPNGFHTRLGVNGTSMSQGQKQRLLIARSIYKNPTFLFFDEATNSLDANNEKVIVENLQDFFIGKTVVIVAHRLSTVKNADKIVVLDNGQIVEEGNHKNLCTDKGKYYELIRNQLELGI